MKAFIVDPYGKKAGVRIGVMPDPELREDDVLVQVHAAGVNVLASKIRNGEFKLLLLYRLPPILGNDLAGFVVRTKEGQYRISHSRTPAPRRENTSGIASSRC